MNRSLNTPVIQVEHLKTKFDTVVISNSLIALLDYDYNQARFLQQLHYWSYSQYGVVIDGIRWIYKSAKEWLSEALLGLTEWKLRKAIASLLEKNLIRREKLFARHQEQEYSRFWWQPKNQTYYYSINYEQLQKLIEKAGGTEIGRIEKSTNLSIEEIKETKVCGLSQNSSENTNHRKVKNKRDGLSPSDLPSASTGRIRVRAASSLNISEEKETASRTAFPCKSQSKEPPSRKAVRKSKNPRQVEESINKNWKSQLKDLDDAGIRLNPTLINLIKSYSFEEVENAIALVKVRRREQYVPNPAGYFTKALEENWAGELLKNTGSDMDTASAFRYWYDLARELGYCSGQEIRNGEQWVCLSGAWEKWQSAIERGYSLDYLKKILKRNKGK